MTGGIVCSVATCKNNSRKAKEDGQLLRFFTFPKDPKLRKEWVRRCYRQDKWDPSKKRICSKHFPPEDYEDAVKAKLLNLLPKKLKTDAVPSLFLHGDEEKPTTERAERQLQKERKVLLDALLKDMELSIELGGKGDSSEIKKEHHKSTTTNVSVSEPADSERLNDILKSEPADSNTLRKRIRMLENQNIRLKRKVADLENSDKKIKQKLRDLEQNLQKDTVEFESKMKLALKDIMTPNQVDIVLKKKVKAHWTTEEYSTAFTLRSFSKQSYLYLRETLNYPLPGLSTLQKWVATIDLRKGVLDDVLRIMDTTAQTKKVISKVTVLSFDEMKVSSLYEYCDKEDEVIGPHVFVQVVMCRGLFDKWKQPIYIGFDQKMSKELLQALITELHKIGYNVVACTSDCDSGNEGLWKEFNLGMENTFIEHPVTKKPIHFFADTPHLLINLRNWFLDTGFVLSSGKIIEKDPIYSLISGAEINSCCKLTSTHLNRERIGREDVGLAAQLFSNTTAVALNLLGDEMATETADFIQLINDWFDIMNSSPSSSVPTKKPYGADLERQNDVLDEVLKTIKGIRCLGKNVLQLFQKAIVMSITSIKNLYIYLSKEYNIEFILTHRLNLDCLQNLFSQIRTRGGSDDHPSPLSAVNRIRMILLGKNPGMVQTQPNGDTVQDGEYLMTSALRKANLHNIAVEDVASESTTFSIYSSNLPITEEAEQDGLPYIAGFLAKQYIKKYPHLGKYTHETMQVVEEHSYNTPPWIQHSSSGGLIQPSEDWLRQVTEMDKHFLKCHKTTFSFRQKILNRTTNYLTKKMTGLPSELVKSFCRQRTYIRIKYLNIKNEKKKIGNKRHSSDTDNRQNIKKLVKIAMATNKC